ncbi:hypothetical protein PABG_03674 [Paracoccidioides brasiliensis Pb03]|nr:hypothetical protein PABG_03674 [Paracoccidioides brasiliensis Pb03]
MRPRFANSGLFPHQEALSVLGRFLGEAPNASELWSPALEPSGYQCHGAFQYLAWISSGFILFVHFYSGRGLAGDALFLSPGEHNESVISPPASRVSRFNSGSFIGGIDSGTVTYNVDSNCHNIQFVPPSACGVRDFSSARRSGTVTTLGPCGRCM